MRIFKALMSVLFLVITANFSSPAFAEEAAQNQVSVRLDFDPFFETYSALTATHAFSANHSLSATFLTYVAFKSIELDLNWSITLDHLVISPGVGITFGPGSWTFSSDTRQFLARDIAPILALYYAGSLFEGESLNAAWLPIQESQTTSVAFIQLRNWGVMKWNELGVGPHVEAFFTKEGSDPWRATHLWLGAHLLANINKSSFQLFLGYDTFSLDEYFGHAKDAGVVFRGTFSTLF